MATNDGKIFGIPISDDIQKQLDLRKNLRSGNNARDAKTLSYLNSRTGWVTLCSSVNVLQPEDQAYEEEFKKLQWKFPLAQTGGFDATSEYNQRVKNLNNQRKNRNSFLNELARQYVLSGGTLDFKYKDGKLNRQADKRNFDLGATPSNNPHYSKYTHTKETGWRAMPGITDFKVKTKSTYGSLIEVELGIKVNSQQDLSAIEVLYFRPGFDMMVQFGSSLYVDQDGEISKMSMDLTKAFLKGAPIKKIFESIPTMRKMTGYHYDALLAKVTNFSWSYATDGTYDCTLKLVSSGEVMESISAVKYDIRDNKSLPPKSEDKDKPNDFLLNLLLTLNSYDNKNVTYKKIKENYDLPNKFLIGDVERDKLDIVTSYTRMWDETVLNEDGEVETDGDGQEKKEKKKENFKFIPLYSLLYLINRTIIRPLLKEKKDLFELNTDVTLTKYITFDQHISGDPLICHRPADKKQVSYFLDPYITKDQIEKDKRPEPIYAIQDNYPDYGYVPREAAWSRTYGQEYFGEKFSMNSPYFIAVGIDHLIKIQEGLLDSKKQDTANNTSIFILLKKVLNDINSALGGINKLDLHLDKEINKWIVIDRNLYEPVFKNKEIPILDIVGQNSLATNFSLDSKISSKLASSLSIAASSTSLPVGNEALFKYNEGTRDRFLKEGEIDDKGLEEYTANKSAIGKSYKKAKQRIADAYTLYINCQDPPSDFSSISSDHRHLIPYLRTYHKVKNAGNNERTYDGLIPIDLSFTLDGITGLKPGEAFSIGGRILPDRYNGKVGFVITQIEQSIKSSRWETDITTKMFMLPDNEVYNPLPDIDDSLLPGKRDSSKIQKNVKAEYGELDDWEAYNTRVKVPKGVNMTFNGTRVRYVRLHDKVAMNFHNAFKEVVQVYGSEKLKDLRINIFDGSYVRRLKRNGTTHSLHSWGIAFDLDAANNQLKWGRDKAAFAKKEYSELLNIMKKYGFYNLGAEKNYDYMHFQAWDPNKPE